MTTCEFCGATLLYGRSPCLKCRKERELVPNRPTAKGYEMGHILALFADAGEKIDRVKFPNGGERCKTCAFRKDTLPNGCEETVMDALKCVIEAEPFLCHQTLDADKKPHELCAGWAHMMAVRDQFPIKKAPWKFSHEYDEEEQKQT